MWCHPVPRAAAPLVPVQHHQTQLGAAGKHSGSRPRPTGERAAAWDAQVGHAELDRRLGGAQAPSPGRRQDGKRLATTSAVAVLQHAEQRGEALAVGTRAPRRVLGAAVERATASRTARREALWRPPSGRVLVNSFLFNNNLNVTRAFFARIFLAGTPSGIKRHVLHA